MIPIRSSLHPRNYPVINIALIIVNLIVFAIEFSQGPFFDEFIVTYSLIPARYSNPDVAFYFTLRQQMLALVTFMFLHANFWHLLGNMWFLHIFGGNVEDRLGHVRYLVFYLMCGLASGIVHLLTNLQSAIPTIGASGAIAGVMGAYFILYPRTKIITLILIIFIPYFIEVPAVIFLGIWAVIQFLSAAVTSSQVGGIAWWAHLGGFVSGIALVKLFEIIPQGESSRHMREATVKQRSPLLHVARRVPAPDEGLHRVVTISPREAARGTRKLVSMPARLGERLLYLTIPPGTVNGAAVRIKGDGGTEKGDVTVHIVVQPGLQPPR